MRIVDSKVFAIRIPLKRPFTIALGTLTHSNHVLVRLVDDKNRVGWGESTTFHAVYGYDQKVRVALNLDARKNRYAANVEEFDVGENGLQN